MVDVTLYQVDSGSVHFDADFAGLTFNKKHWIGQLKSDKSFVEIVSMFDDKVQRIVCFDDLAQREEINTDCTELEGVERTDTPGTIIVRLRLPTR